MGPHSKARGLGLGLGLENLCFKQSAAMMPHGSVVCVLDF